MYFVCSFLSESFWISTLKICLLRSLNNLNPLMKVAHCHLDFCLQTQTYLAEFASMSYKVMSQQNQCSAFLHFSFMFKQCKTVNTAGNDLANRYRESLGGI